MLWRTVAQTRPEQEIGGRDLAKILLVHGGLHGAWCWSKLIPHLKDRGHEVLAIDLPGLGGDATPAAQTTLGDYGDAVVKGARTLGGGVVVVGHSLGGMAISDGAEKAPELFSKLIYLAAIMLADGDTAAAAGIQLDPAITANAVSPIMPREVCEYMFYNDCTKEDVDDIMPRLRPQAVAPMAATMRVTAARWGGVPRFYIACEHDQALTIDNQRAMIARSPVHKTITLPSGHSPFVSMPEQTAAALHEIAAL